MKTRKNELRQIIEQELSKVLDEQSKKEELKGYLSDVFFELEDSKGNNFFQILEDELLGGFLSPQREVIKDGVMTVMLNYLDEMEVVVPGINENKKYKKTFYTAKDKRAEYLIKKGVPEEQAYGVADKQMAKAGKKKKRGKK